MPGRNDSRGLVPTRSLTGSATWLTRRRYTNGRNLSAIRINDPVYLDANNEIQRALTATLAGQQWLGVVVGLYSQTGRPLVNTIPPVLAASTTGYADVCEDPFVVYTVNCSASCNQNMIGRFTNIIYANVGTAAGISSCLLSPSDFTATSIGHPLKVIGISPNELDVDGVVVSGRANNDVEVIITQHKWTGRQRAILVEEGAA